MRGVRLEVGASSSFPDPLSDFSSWWQEPCKVLGRFPDAGEDLSACDWYRIVDGFLGVESEDLALQERFRTLYAEFRSEPPALSEATRTVRCHIQTDDGLAAHLVTFTAPSEIPVIDFILALFSGRGYLEMGGAAAGWRSVGVAGSAHPLLTARGGRVLVDAREAWHSLIANCAVNWVMQLQPELLFFHAASVGIGGEGILITGEKTAGKSTLSLALASRGHDFFGDEIAAVRTGRFELAPFRRAVSVRDGPQAARVGERLKSKVCFTETFLDGTLRLRATLAELFPAIGARPQPLRWVFFLQGFEERPRAVRFRPCSQDLRLLAPLACTFWARSSSARITQVAQLLSSVNCYHLYSGQPEDTAKLLERIVRSE